MALKGTAAAPARAPFNPGTQPDSTSGTPKYLGQFVATAYGPPWVGIQGSGVTADGTDLRPAKQVYGVAVDPSVVPLGTYLNIQPNPFGHSGTFKAFDTGGAIKGKRIDFYDWRGRPSQQKWGKKTVQVYQAASPSSQVSPPATGGGIHLPSIPNPLNAADAAAGAIKDFVTFVTSPKSVGDLLAKVAAYFIKLIFKAVWDFVIAPILHWHQRAVMYYYDHTLTAPGTTGNTGTVVDNTGVPAFITFSFWATGYAILWARASGEGGRLGAEPHNTPLGSLIRSFGNSRARRKLVKPKDVKSKTPKKPTPHESVAKITQTRSLAVKRPRSLRVGRPGVDFPAHSREIAADLGIPEEGAE